MLLSTADNRTFSVWQGGCKRTELRGTDSDSELNLRSSVNLKLSHKGAQKECQGFDLVGFFFTYFRHQNLCSQEQNSGDFFS